MTLDEWYEHGDSERHIFDDAAVPVRRTNEGCVILICCVNIKNEATHLAGQD